MACTCHSETTNKWQGIKKACSSKPFVFIYLFIISTTTPFFLQGAWTGSFTCPSHFILTTGMEQAGCIALLTEKRQKAWLLVFIMAPGLVHLCFFWCSKEDSEVEAAHQPNPLLLKVFQDQAKQMSKSLLGILLKMFGNRIFKIVHFATSSPTYLHFMNV